MTITGNGASNSHVATDNKVYEAELKYVYKQIDKLADLRAPQRDLSEMIWNPKGRSTRQRGGKTSSGKEEVTTAASSGQAATP